MQCKHCRYCPRQETFKMVKTITTNTLSAKITAVIQTSIIEATSTVLQTPTSTAVSARTLSIVTDITTLSTTITATQTVTHTFEAPVQKVYARCQADNFVSELTESTWHPLGYRLTFVLTGREQRQTFRMGGPGSSQLVVVGIGSTPQCRAACANANTNTCDLSLYDLKRSICYLITTPKCSVRVQVSTLLT
jgi:hypothetical protein